MPTPKRKPNEDNQKFVSRCMGDETMKKDYPETKQRVAVCLGQTKKTKSSLLYQVLEILGLSFAFDCETCEEDNQPEELLTLANLIVPKNENYIDFGEVTEEIETSTLAKYEYIDPVTWEKYYFERRGNYKKDGRYLRYEGEAKASEYQGKKVTLNKPFRTPDAKKKFAVYVRNKQGKIIIVRFGSQEMSIKRDDPERRKSFRARHKCDQQKDKTTPAYWSCFQWRANSPVKD